MAANPIYVNDDLSDSFNNSIGHDYFQCLLSNIVSEIEPPGSSSRNFNSTLKEDYFGPIRLFGVKPVPSQLNDRIDGRGVRFQCFDNAGRCWVLGVSVSRWRNEEKQDKQKGGTSHCGEVL